MSADKISHDKLFKFIMIRYKLGNFTDFVLKDKKYYNFINNSLESIYVIDVSDWVIDSNVSIVSNNR